MSDTQPEIEALNAAISRLHRYLRDALTYGVECSLPVYGATLRWGKGHGIWVLFWDEHGESTALTNCSLPQRATVAEHAASLVGALRAQDRATAKDVGKSAASLNAVLDTLCRTAL